MPDVTRIEDALRQHAARYVGVEGDMKAMHGPAMARLLGEKYQVVPIPEESESGSTARADRFASVLYEISGMVCLLLEPGAGISRDDAAKVVNVLSAFSAQRIAALQGRGYHAFVQREAIQYHGLCRPGSLEMHCRKAGLVYERVNYITIDSRIGRPYES